MIDVDDLLRRYSAGEVSAMQAAGQLGLGFTVADVVVMTARAGLPPPEPPLEQQRAELAHARRVLGLPQRD